MTIQASPDRVWEAFGNFQDMSWHPAVVRTEGANGNAPEATRKLTLQGGGTIDEVLAKHEPAQKELQLPDHFGRREGAAGHELLVHPRRGPSRRRFHHGRVAWRLLSRLPQQRPAARIERRGRYEDRLRRLPRRPREPTPSRGSARGAGARGGAADRSGGGRRGLRHGPARQRGRGGRSRPYGGGGAPPVEGLARGSGGGARRRTDLRHEPRRAVPDGDRRLVADVARRIPLSGGPLGIAVHPSGRPVYVADWYGKRLLVVDPDEGRVEASAAVGASPSGVAAPRTER